MGTGTTSNADWVCQGNEHNVHFFKSNNAVTTGLGTRRKVRFPRSTAITCQEEIYRTFSSNKLRIVIMSWMFNIYFWIATVFDISREALSKKIPLAQARLQMQIGHARATKRTFTFSDNKA